MTLNLKYEVVIALKHTNDQHKDIKLILMGLQLVICGIMDLSRNMLLQKINFVLQ